MPTTDDLRQGDPLTGKITDALPAIDASLLLDSTPDAIKKAGDAVKKACLNTGFFYVTNAFGSTEADKKLLSQMALFFNLPDNDPRKQSVDSAASPNGLGWTAVGGESAYQPGTIAHVESFDFGREEDDNNVWPDLADFRETVTTYWDTVTKIGNSILERLAVAVELDPQYFVDRCGTQELNTLRLLHYPKDDVIGDAENVGISAHTDFECLSLLYQTAPGLELTDIKGNWYDTPATEGGLFVFIDDMLELWTNGLLKATGHRVRHTSEQRFSIVLFMAVDRGRTVGPLPEFNGVAGPRRYTPITQEAHIDAEMARAKANDRP